MKGTPERPVGDILRPDLGVTWFVHFMRIHHTIYPCALFCICYTLLKKYISWVDSAPLLCFRTTESEVQRSCVRALGYTSDAGCFEYGWSCYRCLPPFPGKWLTDKGKRSRRVEGLEREVLQGALLCAHLTSDQCSPKTATKTVTCPVPHARLGQSLFRPRVTHFKKVISTVAWFPSLVKEGNQILATLLGSV